MKTVIVLIVFVIQISTSLSIQPCCKGDNLLILPEKKCQDGSGISLSCRNKYSLNSLHDGPLQFDDQGNLFAYSTTTPSERYCRTRINGTDYDTYLICFDDESGGNAVDHIFKMHAIFGLISVAFLLMTIVIYVQLPEVLDLQGICILHSISGLALSFLVLSINKLTTTEISNNLCLSYAYIMYFSMMYAFFWLNVLAFHIWRTIVRPKILLGINYWSRIYHAYGIGGPTLLLILLLIAHHTLELSHDMRPGLGETGCWFKSEKSQFIYFYGPMAVLLCLNVIYYSWTIAILWKNLKEMEEKKSKVLKYRLVLCVRLFVIMGITWIFELLSAAFGSDDSFLKWFWFVTDCLNSLQGIIIFLILVVFRKKVIRQMANRSVCGVRLPNRWRTINDDECEEAEEEFRLSETQLPPKV